MTDPSVGQLQDSMKGAIHMSNIPAIGRRIKALRESRGMTREDLGGILGMDEQAVRELESGDDDDIRVGTIKCLCETFREYPGFLLYGHGHVHWSRMFEKTVGLNGESSDKGGLNSSGMMVMIGKTIESALGEKGLSLIHSVTVLNDSGLARAKSLVDDLLKIGDYREKT